MQWKAGQPIRVQISALNQDGTPQGAPLVDCHVIPAGPAPSEASKVTRYQFVLTNPQGGTQKAELPITIIH